MAKNLDNLINTLAEKHKIRFIVNKGWGNIGNNTHHERIFTVDQVPHTKLFPRVAAIIHHGGAGTVSTAAWAGIPQIIIPLDGDQFFWANRISQLKIGPKPIKFSKINKSLVDTVLSVVSDQETKARANHFAISLKHHNGLDEILSYFNSVNLK